MYRTVDAEGFVAWRGNRYAVPYCHIGRLLPVPSSETALIIYGPDPQEIARHPLLARSCTGQRAFCRPASAGQITGYSKRSCRSGFAAWTGALRRP